MPKNPRAQDPRRLGLICDVVEQIESRVAPEDVMTAEGKGKA